MSFEFIKEVISPRELLKAYPLPEKDVIRKSKGIRKLKILLWGIQINFWL